MSNDDFVVNHNILMDDTKVYPTVTIQNGITIGVTSSVFSNKINRARIRSINPINPKTIAVWRYINFISNLSFSSSDLALK